MSELVFLLEEPSARVLLEGLVPRIVSPKWQLRFITFEGKQDLEKKMVRRMRAWRAPGARFVVLRDQDAGDCRIVKRRLTQSCAEAGRVDALVRVACRELEAWILGDLVAFADEFGRPGASREQNRAKYAEPDRLTLPVRELRSFEPGYQKVDGARRMGLRLCPERNASRSFRAFCAGLRKLTGGDHGE